MNQRVVYAFAIGGVVTMLLAYIMAQLIYGNAARPRNASSEPLIEFIRMKSESITQVRKRELPKKVEVPEKRPPIPRSEIVNSKPTNEMASMKVPKLDLSLSLGGGNGPYLGQVMEGGPNGEVMPLVRIEPQYPRKAAMDGKEGWVLLEFDITELGTVENVRVLQSQPVRLFDTAAKNALIKWKYKPKIEEGKPISQPNNRVKIEFSLKG